LTDEEVASTSQHSDLFKSHSWLDMGLAVLVTFFLVATARIEEVENIKYFGDEYSECLKRTKMFVLFVF